MLDARGASCAISATRPAKALPNGPRKARHNVITAENKSVLQASGIRGRIFSQFANDRVSNQMSLAWPSSIEATASPADICGDALDRNGSITTLLKCSENRADDLCVYPRIPWSAGHSGWGDGVQASLSPASRRD